MLAIAILIGRLLVIKAYLNGLALLGNRVVALEDLGPRVERRDRLDRICLAATVHGVVLGAVSRKTVGTRHYFSVSTTTTTTALVYN